MPDINPTELVDDRLLEALSDDDTGFNVAWASIIAVRPSLPAVTIDWAEGSGNYVRYQFLPSDVKAFPFPKEELGLAQYTTECRSDPGGAKGLYFDGTVRAHLDFYVAERRGVTSNESYAELFKHALVNAVCQSVHNRQLTWFHHGNVQYAHEFLCIPEFASQEEDGYMQKVAFELVFPVFI